MEGFIIACKNGDLNEAKQAFITERLDIHAHDDRAFRWSCSNGHLTTAQWLSSLDNKVDIHAYDDCAFRSSCVDRHLSISQWLYALDGKIDIHAHNDCIFRLSCDKDHIFVTHWLLNIERFSSDMVNKYAKFYNYSHLR